MSELNNLSRQPNVKEPNLRKTVVHVELVVYNNYTHSQYGIGEYVKCEFQCEVHSCDKAILKA